VAHVVAVATTDGKTIYQHFGWTEVFHIISLDEDEYIYLESRHATASCQGFQHDESSFDRVLTLLRDCEALFVGKIGPGAAGYLIARGMRVFESPGILDDVLNEVIRQKLLDKKAAP
jgi:predicted Fe-Mo cluster-binding NifX family protein